MAARRDVEGEAHGAQQVVAAVRLELLQVLRAAVGGRAAGRVPRRQRGGASRETPTVECLNEFQKFRFNSKN